jgi:hypothetical protein
LFFAPKKEGERMKGKCKNKDEQGNCKLNFEKCQDFYEQQGLCEDYEEEEKI